MASIVARATSERKSKRAAPLCKRSDRSVTAQGTKIPPPRHARAARPMSDELLAGTHNHRAR